MLLESARFRGLDYCATLKAEAAIDSVCAEYQPYLWQEYGLLFLDGAYGAEEFSVGYVLEQLADYMESDALANDWLNDWLGLDLLRLEKAEAPLQYSCLENPHGQRSLPGYSPWDRQESDTTKQLSTVQPGLQAGCHLP